MRRQMLLVVIGLCAALPSAARAEDGPSASFHCEDGASFIATFTPPDAASGSASLAFAGGETLVLPQGLSADGGRYVEGETEFWVKGDGASFTRDGRTTTCKVTP